VGLSLKAPRGAPYGFGWCPIADGWRLPIACSAPLGVPDELEQEPAELISEPKEHVGRCPSGESPAPRADSEGSVKGSIRAPQSFRSEPSPRRPSACSVRGRRPQPNSKVANSAVEVRGLEGAPNGQPMARAGGAGREGATEIGLGREGPVRLLIVTVCLPAGGGPWADWRCMRRGARPLLCELHAHTTWSDGELSLGALIDLYGAGGFDVLCVTDHVLRGDDPWPLRHGRPCVDATNVDGYLAEIERERVRALSDWGTPARARLRADLQ
jgi:hypothetical protein